MLLTLFETVLINFQKSTRYLNNITFKFNLGEVIFKVQKRYNVDNLKGGKELWERESSTLKTCPFSISKSFSAEVTESIISVLAHTIYTLLVAFHILLYLMRVIFNVGFYPIGLPFLNGCVTETDNNLDGRSRSD